MSLLPLRNDLASFLEEFLPFENPHRDPQKPFVTLTYAQSLDSRISKGRGLRTTISHAETKTMTHYLRYQHDAILIGCGTALADDAGLNCKWAPPGKDTDLEHSPRPIIIDPHGKWKYQGSKMQELYCQKLGKKPIIIVKDSNAIIGKHPDVTYINGPLGPNGDFDWLALMHMLKGEYDLQSVMVEGGAFVINELLSRPDIVDSLIITVGAKFLGKQGVEVTPPSGEIVLQEVQWWRGKVDAVMGARLAPL